MALLAGYPQKVHWHITETEIFWKIQCTRLLRTLCLISYSGYLLLFFPGFIGHLKLEIPFSRPKSQPWIICIDRLYIIAGPQLGASVSLDNCSWITINFDLILKFTSNALAPKLLFRCQIEMNWNSLLLREKLITHKNQKCKSNDLLTGFTRSVLCSY